MKLPRDIGPVHFVGIGGIGMSGIAEVLLNLGYTVQGSDAPRAPTSNGCATRASTIAIGHNAENVAGAEVVVVSTRRSSATIRNWSRRARSGCRWCAAPKCWPN
jgi:UDP-N-acetylmuramate--alanine ligase